MRQALLLMVLSISALPAQAGEARAPSDSSAHRYEGLFFEFSVIPQYEIGPSVAERGEIALLGPGYAFSRMWAVSLLFATGSRVVEPSATRPVSGRFGFGGACLEVTYSLTRKGPFRPYCSAGAGLYSIINVTAATGTTAMVSTSVRGSAGNRPITSGADWDSSMKERGSLIRYNRLEARLSHSR
jgi:hypothetical protein